MNNLGKKIYDRYDNWINLNNYIENLHKSIEQIKQAVNDEKTKIEKKQLCYLTNEDFDKINKLVEDAIKKLDETKDKFEQGVKTENTPLS